MAYQANPYVGPGPLLDLSVNVVVLWVFVFYLYLVHTQNQSGPLKPSNKPYSLSFYHSYICCSRRLNFVNQGHFNKLRNSSEENNEQIIQNRSRRPGRTVEKNTYLISMFMKVPFGVDNTVGYGRKGLL